MGTAHQLAGPETRARWALARWRRILLYTVASRFAGPDRVPGWMIIGWEPGYESGGSEMASAASPERLKNEIFDRILAEVPVRVFPMGAHFTRLATAVQMLLDLGSVIFAMAVAYKGYRLLGLGQRIYYPAMSYLLTAAVVAIGFVMLMERYGLYQSDSSLLNVRETEAVLRGALMAAAIFVSAGFFFLQFIPSRWIVGLAFILVLCVVEIQRAAYYAFLRRLHLRD